MFYIYKKRCDVYMIKASNLTKKFRIAQAPTGRFSIIRSLIRPVYTEKYAVNNICFTINEGDIVGYIGQNGAGKSTTIKMLSGILVPTTGSIQVNGINPFEERKKHLYQIGTVFGQKTSLWWDVPVIDSFNILKEMYRVDDHSFQENLNMFVDILDMSSFLQQPVRQLSLGQRMRADLAAAMIHSPQILFLDEPTIGLDVIAKQKLRDFIVEINRTKGVTIMLTTHDMVEMEKLATKIIVIDEGHIVFDGSIQELRNRYGYRRTVCLEFSNKPPEFRMAGTDVQYKDNNVIEVTFDPNLYSVGDIITEVHKKDVAIKDITIQETDIDHVVSNIYTQKGRENE